MMCLTAFILGACSKNEHDVKSTQITLVVNNKEFLQENALYQFENGQLDVYLTFSLFENPNTNPSDSEYDKKLEEIVNALNKEYPNEKMTNDWLTI
ncbi:hypothetical protein [Vagococcus luciliae]|uniref:Uncharacterized protein n=1 Tax=Vagococcus luciliae TaxID=2920380 RepID=A0ABY5P0H8_9ENTE|nr:hypothetical protein [Vagococcus luciliae]UUV99309.1 hypothetical protein G314FT_14700 [Vagococcus luciliae]